MEYEELVKLFKNLLDAIIFSSIGYDKPIRESMKQLFERIYKESLDYEKDKKNISDAIDSIQNRIEHISGLLLNIETEKANELTLATNRISSRIENIYGDWKKSNDTDISISRKIVLKACECYQDYIDILISEIRQANKSNREIEVPNRVVL